ncbi:MAG: hypothetical protein P8P21_09135 [Paracoccaceae bacterium]|nr:hypothetical protein [Paracoccaceae bacterium]
MNRTLPKVTVLILKFSKGMNFMRSGFYGYDFFKFLEAIFGHQSTHFLKGIVIAADTQRTRKSRLAEPQTFSGILISSIVVSSGFSYCSRRFWQLNDHHTSRWDLA